MQLKFKKSWLINIAVVLLLVIMLTVSVLSVKDDAVTGDEIIYPPAGYSYWLYHRYDINYEHAPFLKLWMSLPYLILRPTLEESAVGLGSQWEFGRQFFFHANQAQADSLLFWSRCMIILLMLGFGLFLYWAMKRWWGPVSGLLAVFLYSFSPNLIAHGRLATFDFGVAAFMFVALYFWIEWLQHQKLKDVVFSGIFFAIAQVSKFSALMLVPIFLILLIIKLVQRRKSFKAYVKKMNYGLALFTILSVLIIWLVYWIPTWNMTQESVETKITETLADTKTPFPGFFKPLLLTLNQNNITRPLAMYGTGVIRSYDYTKGPIGNFPQYLYGNFNDMGWWYYYLAAIPIKEPVPVLILFALSLGLAIWQGVRRKFPDFTVTALWTTVLLVLVLPMGSSLNIGIRYLLILFPLLYLLISKYVPEFLNNLNAKRKRVGQIILAGLFVWLIGSNVFIFPSYLAYFNELIGGPKNGYNYLIDSNVDWGQDLKRLDQWAVQNHISKIYLDYFGQADTKHYLSDVEVIPWSVSKGTPPDGYLAMSVTFFQTSTYWQMKGSEKLSYDYLKNVEPLARIGYSINVYDVAQVKKSTPQ